LDKIKNIDVDLSTSLSEAWRILTAKEREILRANATIRYFKRKEKIYSEGEEPKDMMCLLEGKVKISKRGVGGRNQIIRMIRPIHHFAYRAFFAREPYLTDATAFEPSKVCIIPMAVVESLIRANSNLAVYYIRQLSVDLGIADARTVNLTQKHIRGRLADSILFLLDCYGYEDDEITLSIYLTRKELANLSSMSVSNAIRTLSTFVAEQIILLNGRKLKIIDEERLRKISKLG